MCRAQVGQGVCPLGKRCHQLVVPRRAVFKERKAGERQPVGGRLIHTPNSRGIPLNLISKYPDKGITEYNIEYK